MQQEQLLNDVSKNVNGVKCDFYNVTKCWQMQSDSGPPSLLLNLPSSSSHHPRLVLFELKNWFNFEAAGIALNLLIWRWFHCGQTKWLYAANKFKCWSIAGPTLNLFILITVGFQYNRNLGTIAAIFGSHCIFSIEYGFGFATT